jgi:circadian clock protein KaiC
MREHQCRCLVIDPLSALIKVGGPSDSNDVVVRLLALAKSLGITTVCTSLLQDGSSNAEATSMQISSIADTWIHLANIATAGERNRALTVVKSRGMAHSNQVRELILDSTGIALSNVYTSDGEVLMGTLRWAKESADKATREVARLEFLRRRRELEAADAEAKIRIVSINREISLRAVDRELLDRRDAATRLRRASDQTEAKRRRGGDDDAVAVDRIPTRIKRRS